MTGGTIVGYCSQTFGHRFTIIFESILGCLLLYPYCFVTDTKIIPPAFFEQFCVQGAWGAIPIHLMELSPGSFRTFVVGTSYQLSNLVSSASSTIEATIGERFPLPPNGTTTRYEYGKVICISMGCAYMYAIIMAFAGPEYRNRLFDVAHDHDKEEATYKNHDAIEHIAQGDIARADSDPEKGQQRNENAVHA